jgi:hypothetical protein
MFPLLVRFVSENEIVDLQMFANISAVRQRNPQLQHSKAKESKAVPLHAMVAFGGRGSIDPTHC